MESGKKKVLIIAIISCVLLLLVGSYFIITEVILNNEETETAKKDQSEIDNVENLDIEMTIGDEIDLTNYIGSSETIEKVELSDSSLFLLENNKIKSLSEGVAVLTVTYKDGTTKMYSLKSTVETSNASLSSYESFDLSQSCKGTHKLFLKNSNGTVIKDYLTYIEYRCSNLAMGEDPLAYDYDEFWTINENVIPIPIKNGYRFSGFYTSILENGKVGGIQVIDANGKVKIGANFTSDMTLYAKWLKVGSGSYR